MHISWTTIGAAKLAGTVGRTPSEAMIQEGVKQVQRELTALGLYKGSIDGKWGDRTEAAKSAFLDRHATERYMDDKAILAAIRSEARGAEASPLAVPSGNGVWVKAPRTVPPARMTANQLVAELESFNRTLVGAREREEPAQQVNYRRAADTLAELQKRLPHLPVYTAGYGAGRENTLGVMLQSYELLAEYSAARAAVAKAPDELKRYTDNEVAAYQLGSDAIALCNAETSEIRKRFEALIPERVKLRAPRDAPEPALTRHNVIRALYGTARVDTPVQRAMVETVFALSLLERDKNVDALTHARALHRLLQWYGALGRNPSATIAAECVREIRLGFTGLAVEIERDAFGETRVSGGARAPARASLPG